MDGADYAKVGGLGGPMEDLKVLKHKNLDQHQILIPLHWHLGPHGSGAGLNTLARDTGAGLLSVDLSRLSGH